MLPKAWCLVCCRQNTWRYMASLLCSWVSQLICLLLLLSPFLLLFSHHLPSLFPSYFCFPLPFFFPPLTLPLSKICKYIYFKFFLVALQHLDVRQTTHTNIPHFNCIFFSWYFTVREKGKREPDRERVAETKEIYKKCSWHINANMKISFPLNVGFQTYFYGSKEHVL